MDTRDEHALQSGDFPTIETKDCIVRNKPKENETPEFSFQPSMYIPKALNIFSLFSGNYRNVIPEEGDGADHDSPHIPHMRPSGDYSIASKVEEMGFTAAAPNTNSYEPYWAEVTPRVKPFESRRHSAGTGYKKSATGKTGNVKEEKTVLCDVAIPPALSDSNVRMSEQTKDDLSLLTEKTIDKMAKFHDDTGLDYSGIFDTDMFSGISNIARTPSNNAALRVSKRSNVYARGDIFRRNDNSENTSSFVRGRMFGSKKGHKRSNSTGKINQLVQEEAKALESTTPQFIDDTKVEEMAVVEPVASGLRRTSSTGALQRLQNAPHLYQEMENKLENIHKDQKNKDEKYRSDESLKSATATPVKKVTDKLSNLGRQTVSWATTSKVSSSKRERQMFSPTSF